MPNPGKCPICTNNATIHEYELENDQQMYDCNYCGKYYFLHSFETDLIPDKLNFYKVSSWIYEQNNSFDTTPEIDQNKFEDLLNMSGKKIKDKFDSLMTYLQKFPEGSVPPQRLSVVCWAKDNNELSELYQKAIDERYINGKVARARGGISQISSFEGMTFNGIEYVEKLEEPNKNSKQVFAAFYFSDEIKEIFDNQVRQAVEECGLSYKRISSSTAPHDTTINDEIIAMIKSSRIVIADFTDHRNSVYFEAGYALGMKLPLIWTCRSDHADKLSFDTRQYPHILWDTADDLQQQLINRIKTIL